MHTAKKTTLQNGLRIVTIPMKNNPTVTVSVFVNTGSEFETKEQNGLSHFLEHMCFKGTKKRSLFDITNELDGLGAESNAFTGDEYTGYYAKGSAKNAVKLIDIVSDLYLNPTLPAEEIEKERGVIIEELNMYEDLPQRKVWEVFTELLYGDQPAGRPIIGTKENIKAFSREQFASYRDTHYVAKKTIVVVAGDIKEKQIIKQIENIFKEIPKTKKTTKEKIKEFQIKPEIKIHQKKTDQCHLVLGFRTFGLGDKRAKEAELLATVLGKGMSSRLFKKMRAERGMCYYVQAANDLSTDHGFFTVSAGVSKSRLLEAVELIIEEFREIIKNPVTEKELDKSKEFLVGNRALSLESSDELASFYGLKELLLGKIQSFEEENEKIKKINAKSLQKVAREIFKNERLNLAVVGDITEKDKIASVLKL